MGTAFGQSRCQARGPKEATGRGYAVIPARSGRAYHRTVYATGTAIHFMKDLDLFTRRTQSARGLVRTKTFGIPHALLRREASWSAAVLCRFGAVPAVIILLAACVAPRLRYPETRRV